MTHEPTLVPYLSYADAKATMAFLTAAIGFESVQAFDGPDGRLMHGEMRHDNGVMMLGSAEGDVDRQSPGVYVVVPDVDAHFEAARAAGAEIVYPPGDTDIGTRRYRLRDPEGHEWSFGTYQPRTEAAEWV